MRHKHIRVVPISNKAKNRLANQMNKDSCVLIEQETEHEYFCASSNRNYFFWMHKTNDKDWKVCKEE